MHKANLSIFDSLKHSKSLLDGRWWKVFLISLTLIFAMVLVVMVILFVSGALVAILGKTVAGLVISFFGLIPTTIVLTFQMHLYSVLEETK